MKVPHSVGFDRVIFLVFWLPEYWPERSDIRKTDCDMPWRKKHVGFGPMKNGSEVTTRDFFFEVPFEDQFSTFKGFDLCFEAEVLRVANHFG